MYCGRCGAVIPDDAEYCEFCGGSTSKHRVGHPQWKDPFRTIVYSFLIIGGGQMYIGQMRRGVCFLVSAAVLSFLIIVLAWFADQKDALSLALMVACSMALFLVWVVNVFDAYNRVKIRNNGLVDKWNQSRVQ